MYYHKIHNDSITIHKISISHAITIPTQVISSARLFGPKSIRHRFEASADPSPKERRFLPTQVIPKSISSDPSHFESQFIPTQVIPIPISSDPSHSENRFIPIQVIPISISSDASHSKSRFLSIQVIPKADLFRPKLFRKPIWADFSLFHSNPNSPNSGRPSSDLLLRAPSPS